MSITSNPQQLFNYLCGVQGDCDTAKRLFDLKPTLCSIQSDTLINVCKNAHLDVLNWLLWLLAIPSTSSTIVSTDIDTCKRIAFDTANFEMAKLLLVFQRFVTINDMKYFLTISGLHENVECAKWIIDFAKDHNELFKVRNAVYELFIRMCKTPLVNAVKTFFEMLIYLEFNTTLISTDGCAFSNACSHGCLDTMLWLLSVCPASEHSVATIKHAFKMSCENGHVNTARYVFDHLSAYVRITSADINAAFRMACHEGHLCLAKWLFGLKPNFNVSGQNDCAFRYACEGGHIDVAKWLVSVKPSIDVSVMNHFAFRVACRNGHEEVVKWLVSQLQQQQQQKQKPSFVLSIDVCKQCFISACNGGHLNLAVWLFHQNNECLFGCDQGNLFANLGRYGHVNVATWLMTVSNADLSVHMPRVFMFACTNGKLAFAQWVISVNPSVYVGEHTFKLTCENGFLDVAKWLMHMYPLMRSCVTDKFFSKMCVYGNEPMVEWLSSFDPSTFKYSINSLNKQITCLIVNLPPMKKALNVKEELNMCVVCYEPEDIEANCGHSLCNHCLEQCVFKYKHCPYCRQPFKFIRKSVQAVK